MINKHLDQLIKARAEETRKRHPMISKIVPGLAVFVMVSTMMAGMFLMVFRFPELRTEGPLYDIAYWGVLVVSAIAGMLVIFVASQIQRWLDRSKEDSRRQKNGKDQSVATTR